MSSRTIINNSFYFLTTATSDHENYFNTDEKKRIILEQLNKVKKKYRISLYAYSVAKNHYHLLFYLKNKDNLKDIIRVINGGSSFILNKLDGVNRRVWDNYWTKVILEENMFYNVLGYIIGNLLRHKELYDFKELRESDFSSFSQIINKYGLEFAEDLVGNVIELDLEKDFKFEKYNLRNVSAKVG